MVVKNEISINQSINLIQALPDDARCLPECVVEDLWLGRDNLLISIDGGNRSKNLSD